MDGSQACSAAVADNGERVVLPTLWKRLCFALAWQLGLLRYLWYVRLGRRPLRAFGAVDSGTAGVEYSMAYFKSYSPDARIFWTLFLLASIPDSKKDSLLIIGPRYETELLLACSLGYRKGGVRGLDTYSYSPMIDVGDMHSMRYASGTFSNIICGWTLSYSVRPGVAAEEMARVLAPGGYLVVSVQRVPEDYVETIKGVLGPEARIQTLDGLDALFPELERVAGFEPRVVGPSSHTVVAYRKRGSRSSG